VKTLISEIIDLDPVWRGFWIGVIAYSVWLVIMRDNAQKR
jgi:hypothetical protein